MISFSFYLLHQPILLLLAPWVHKLHLSPFGTLALGMTGGVAACAVAGRIFFNFVERPFLVRGGIETAIVNHEVNRVPEEQQPDARDRTGRGSQAAGLGVIPHRR